MAIKSTINRSNLNRLFEQRQIRPLGAGDETFDGEIVGKDNLRNRFIITPSGSRQNLVVVATTEQLREIT